MVWVTAVFVTWPEVITTNYKCIHSQANKFRKPRRVHLPPPVYHQGIRITFAYECHRVKVLIRGWSCLRLEGILVFNFISQQQKSEKHKTVFKQKYKTICTRNAAPTLIWQTTKTQLLYPASSFAKSSNRRWTFLFESDF